MASAQGLIRLAGPRAHRSSSSGWTSTTGHPFSLSLCCFYAGGSSGRYVQQGPLSRREMAAENLWREFFSDLSQWWDTRTEKVNARYPDFKHKKTQQSLWLHNSSTPPWVESELAAITTGTLQSHIFSWHVRLRRHVKAGEFKKTLNLFQQMQREGIILDKFTFIPVLNACSSLRSLEEGRLVHEEIIRRSCESDVYIATCLVDMYAKCGSIQDAWSVFNKMPVHDVVSWNAIIVGLVKSGEGLKAMELFRKMKQEGVDPSFVTYIGVLNACASVAALEEGRRFHEEIVRRDCESHVRVGTCLVDMYARCGSMGDAWTVFNKMREHNVVSWNAIIGGCVKSGQGLKAMSILRKMGQEGIEPDRITFVGLLNACAILVDVEEGRSVHEEVIRRGHESDVYVATCLVDMYAKCGSMEDAWTVFNKLREHGVVSWNAMIGGYVKSGQGLKVMELFGRMRQEGVDPDTVTFVAVLSACASLAALEEGRHVHRQIKQRGFESDPYIANCLVDMYVKCGSIDDACVVFNKMRAHDVVSWNALIGGFVLSGQGLKAMSLLQEMRQEGVEPDPVTFVGLLNSCASIMALEEGRCIHEEIIRRGFECDVYVANCLVHMYSKCGSIDDAWSVFKKMPEHSVVSWNAMITGCVKSGQGLKAMGLFTRMRQEGVQPDAGTFVGLLNVCASTAALKEGRLLHEEISQSGCESDVYIATCLVDMYAKCGSIEDAWSMFNKMQGHDVVSWNALIGGYVRSGQGLEAMELLGTMQQEGVQPDAVTFALVLNACASVAALEEGRGFHEQVIGRGCQSDVYLCNCLVDMYAKCGSIEDAWSVFNGMVEHNVVSWNAMIGAYGMHGHAKKAIEIFKQMGKEGVEINGVTFTCLLSACSHGGLVKEGLRYFKSMTSCNDLLPTIEHYAGIVDLLGRAGLLKEAEEITKRLPLEGDATVWISLLGACKIHGNIEMAEQAAKQCCKLNP